MKYSDYLELKVYEISTGNINTFIRFENTPRKVDNIESLLQSHLKLREHLGPEENYSLVEIWQTPIPFSRGLGFATLFRLNPYDKAFLVSPVRMEWLEGEEKTLK